MSFAKYCRCENVFRLFVVHNLGTSKVYQQSLATNRVHNALEIRHYTIRFKRIRSHIIIYSKVGDGDDYFAREVIKRFKRQPFDYITSAERRPIFTLSKRYAFSNLFLLINRKIHLISKYVQVVLLRLKRSNHVFSNNFRPTITLLMLCIRCNVVSSGRNRFDCKGC